MYAMGAQLTMQGIHLQMRYPCLAHFGHKVTKNQINTFTLLDAVSQYTVFFRTRSLIVGLDL